VTLYPTGTDTASALTFAQTVVFSPAGGNRLNVKDILIIITDGGSNINRDLTIPTAGLLHDQGITVFVIAVGLSNPGWSTELQGLASGPVDDHLFEIASFGDLAFLDNTLVARTCREQPARMYSYIDRVYFRIVFRFKLICNF